MDKYTGHPVMAPYPFEVLDVQDFDSGVDSEGVEDGVDVAGLDVSADVLLEAQHPATRLKFPRIASDHLAQPPHMGVLHQWKHFLSVAISAFL